MAADSTAQEVDQKRTVTLRLSADEYEAVEYMSKLFPKEYDGVAPVLRDHSVKDCVETQQRALAMNPAGSLS